MLPSSQFASKKKKSSFNSKRMLLILSSLAVKLFDKVELKFQIYHNMA